MLTCSKCRAQLPEDALHCPSCGADVPTDPGIDPAVLRASKAVTAPIGVKPKPEDIHGRLQKAMGPNYDVKGCVGRGGFAEVYEVLDIHLERRLAAKVLMPEIAANPGTRQRFTHEARTVARLNDPAILPIHFVGDAENLAYYVMPFIEGDSVQDVLRHQGKMTTAETVAVAKPILEALSHAHEVGLIHRDIKPDNVMIDAKTHRALLVDFGIAKAVDSDKASNLTQTGHAVGTPYFMSPEQALGDKLDGRSDLYSFGAMLFEMVTGRKPYDGDSAHEVVSKHVADPIPIPSEVDPTVPDWLSDVIVRLLQKQPDDRYQTAADVVAALDEKTVADYSALDSLSSHDFPKDGMVIQGSGWAMDDNLEPSEDIRPPDSTVYTSDVRTVEPEEEKGWDPTTGMGGNTLGMMSLHDQASRATPAEPVEPPAKEEPVAVDQPPPTQPPATKRPKPEPTPPEPRPEAKPQRPPAHAPLRPEVQETKGTKPGSKQWLDRRKIVMIAAAAVVVFVVGPWIQSRIGLIGKGTTSGVPSTFVINSLIEPVELLVNGQIADTLQPNQRDTLPHVDGRRPRVSWRLIRPVRSDGQPLGGEFNSGFAAGAEGKDNVTLRIVGRARNRAMFAPVISNPTDQSLSVLINADLPEAIRCECVIPPRSQNVRIGYYSLLGNATLRFYPSSSNYRGRYVEIIEMAGSVDALSGELRVEISMPRR